MLFGIDVFEVAATILAMLISVVLHEVSHGFVAYLCGDPTAKEAGRLTLNPVKHLDPFGSVILPAVMIMLRGPVFAYAKPVPYDPRYLRHRRRCEEVAAFLKDNDPAKRSKLVDALLADGCP